MKATIVDGRDMDIIVEKTFLVLKRFRDIVLSLKAGDTVRITTPDGEAQRTCVYIVVDSEGNLCFRGGASIIGRITGEGMAEKVEGVPGCSDKEKALMIVIQKIFARQDQRKAQLDEGTLKLFEIVEIAKRIHLAESESEFQAAIADLEKF